MYLLVNTSAEVAEYTLTPNGGLYLDLNVLK